MDTTPGDDSGDVLGRAAELDWLRGALDDASHGRGSLLALTGQAGIGKTCLAEAFTAMAQRRGALALWGACWEGGGAPAYWPWVQVLRRLVRSRDDAALRRELGAGAPWIAELVPEVRQRLDDVPEAGALESDQARFALFDAVAELLLAAAQRDLVAVVLDDLHLADRPSLLLLEFVARTLPRAPIVVVATYRDVELQTRAEAADVLSELGRLQRSIPLRGLDAGSVGTLIERRAERSVTSSLVHAVHGATEGNPFFVDELVRLLYAEGHLDAETVPEPLPIPQGVRDTVLRRLEPLPPDALEALETGAVAGPAFRLETLAGVLGTDPAQALARLEPALGLRAIVTDPGRPGVLTFSHALVRDALCERLAAPRRAELHLSIGRTLAARVDVGEAGAAEVAHHLLRAAPLGDAEEAVAFAWRAGDSAMRVLAYEEAVDLYRQAAELVTDDERRCDLLLALGAAQTRAGEAAAARETLLEAAASARRLGAPRRFARAAIGLKAGALGLAAGIVDAEHVALLTEALGRLGPEETSLRARLTAELAVARYWAGDVAHVSQLAEQAVALARQAGDERELMTVLGLAHLATLGPSSATRVERVEEILALTERLDDREMRLLALTWYIPIKLELGDVAGAERALATFVQLAEMLHQPRMSWYVATYRGLRAMMAGDFAGADRLADEALEISREVSGSFARGHVAASRFANRWLQGRPEDALDIAATAAASVPAMTSWRAAVCLALAYAERLDEAATELDRMAIDDFAHLPRDVLWLTSLALLSEAVWRLGDAERARTLYELLAPYRDRCLMSVGSAWLGPADRFLGMLAATFGDSDQAERHLDEARARAAACGARPVVAHIALVEGRLLAERAGAAARAKAADVLDEAAQLAGELDMERIAEEAATLRASLQAPAPVAASAAEPAAAPRAQDGAARMRREGEVWTLSCAGRTVRVRDAKGLHYLAVLLAHPGVEIHAAELVAGRGPGATSPAAAAARDEGLAATGDDGVGPALDPRAKREYRARLEDLRAEVEEAEAFNDPERAARAREELDFLARELAGAVGLGGRDRKQGSSAERARVNVTRAIRSVVRRVAEHDPELGRELDVTVRTGTFCCYEPDPRRPLAWEIDAG